MGSEIADYLTDCELHRCVESNEMLEVIERSKPPSDELPVVQSYIWIAFKYGKDATITKAFIFYIFVEVETAFLLVTEKVEVLFGKFLFDRLLIICQQQR